MKIFSLFFFAAALLASACTDTTDVTPGDGGDTGVVDRDTDLPDLGLNDVGDVDDEDEIPPLCFDWCDHTRGCGLIGVDDDECTQACAEVLDDPFLEACTPCLEGAACGDVRGECFEDGQPCHRPATTSYLATIGGFDEDANGRPGVGRLITYDGESLDAFAEGEVVDGNLMLSFGTVLVEGMHYRLQYFVDLDEDGVCEPGVDLPYEYDEVFIDKPSVVVYGIVGNPEETSPEVCDAFLSVADLCLERCATADTCGTLDEPVDDCVATCSAELSPGFLLGCVACLESFDCSMHPVACDQQGGLCDEDHLPPDAEFLFSGTKFGDYEDLAVRVQVQDLAAQALTPLTERVITDGGFFIHFGMVVWMHQTYQVVFYIDLDDTGACDDGDPGWRLEYDIEDSVLYYPLHEYTPEEVTDVCDLIDDEAAGVGE